MDLFQEKRIIFKRVEQRPDLGNIEKLETPKAIPNHLKADFSDKELERAKDSVAIHLEEGSTIVLKGTIDEKPLETENSDKSKIELNYGPKWRESVEKALKFLDKKGMLQDFIFENKVEKEAYALFSKALQSHGLEAVHLLPLELQEKAVKGALALLRMHNMQKHLSSAFKDKNFEFETKFLKLDGVQKNSIRISIIKPKPLDKLRAQSKRTEKVISSPASKELETAFASELPKLSKNLKTGDKAFFIDGSNQQVYIVEKTSRGMTFKKQFSTSTGRNGFGWRNGQTPTGLYFVDHTVRGKFGCSIRYGGVQKEIVSDVRNANGGKHPTRMTTASMHLTHVGKNKKTSIRIHGTNYEDKLGNQASGGCIRTSNLDVERLYETTLEQEKNGKMYVYVTSQKRSMIASVDQP
jgi:lipoprotein-anchoring transpeptidase ErfK/SrfK